jgi:hypothetical protein
MSLLNLNPKVSNLPDKAWDDPMRKGIFGLFDYLILSKLWPILTGELVGITCLEQRKTANVNSFITWKPKQFPNGWKQVLMDSVRDPYMGKPLIMPGLIVGRKATQETFVRRFVNNLRDFCAVALFNAIAGYGATLKSVIFLDRTEGKAVRYCVISEYRKSLNSRVNDKQENFGRATQGVINLALICVEVGTLIVEMRLRKTKTNRCQSKESRLA